MEGLLFDHEANNAAGRGTSSESQSVLTEQAAEAFFRHLGQQDCNSSCSVGLTLAHLWSSLASQPSQLNICTLCGWTQLQKQ